MSNQKTHIVSFIGVMFLVGLLFTGSGVYLAIRAVGAGSWESTKGTITRSGEIWGQSIFLSVALTPKKGNADFSDSVSCPDFSVREVCDGSLGSQ